MAHALSRSPQASSTVATSARNTDRGRHGRPAIGQSADQYYTADDDEARTTAATLIAATGLRPIFTGGSDRVSVVDGITRLWFTLAVKQDLGRHIGFHLLTDTSNP